MPVATGRVTNGWSVVTVLVKTLGKCPILPSIRTICTYSTLVTAVAMCFCLYSRVTSLEKENAVLDKKMTDISITVNELVKKSNRHVVHPPEDIEHLVRKENRVKRSIPNISPSTVTSSIQNSSSNFDGIVESPHNGSVIPEYEHHSDTDTLPLASLTRGNRKLRNERRKMAMLSTLRKLTMKDKGTISKLRIKLETARQNTQKEKALAEALKQHLAACRNETEAAHLILFGNNMEFENPNQIIGPWEYSESPGREFGFYDRWYSKLDLVDNGTGVMFKEDGLFTISAQVLFTHIEDSSSGPVGFRITVKHNENSTVHFEGKRIYRPRPIAECIPSFPADLPGTCYTQITWYLKAGDRIYLENSNVAKPVIATEKPIQTFLQIIRI